MSALYKNVSTTVVLAFVLVFSPLIAAAQLATTSEHSEKTLTISDVRVTENRLLGEITNNSENKVQDISLMVQHMWRWKDGYNPKIEAPVNAALFKLQKDLVPGETATFSYMVSLPTDNRSDGHFVTDVSVAGFKLIRPEEAPRFSSVSIPAD